MKPSVHRPTRALINIQAIKANIQSFKQHVAPKVPQLFAVVKANAYGHGVSPLVQRIQDDVDGFCVSNIDEALELRSQQVTKPILVLSGIQVVDAKIAKDLAIRLTAPSLAWVESLIASNTSDDLSGLFVHIKVDSGMGRIGAKDATEVNQMVARLQENGAIVEGLFTHFATADEADQTQFLAQETKFASIVSQLNYDIPYIHATNSAAGIWHKTSVGDIERYGAAMYGLNPSGGSLSLPYDLQPALSLVSRLTHVKTIQKGEKVGYGGTYEALSDTIVGTVPIGYADGWTRDMQGFYVLVDGQVCEIVGRVSMDQMTIKLPQAFPLDTEVVLIGQSGHKCITVDDVANHRGTINYEVVCLLSDRIPREYDA